MKKRYFIFILLSVLTLSSCELNKTSKNINSKTAVNTSSEKLPNSVIEQSDEAQVISTEAIVITTMICDEKNMTSDGTITKLLSDEIYNTPLIKDYLTIDLAERSDLKKEKIDEGYKYSNEFIFYYYDESGNLSWVSVISNDGNIIGPRGIIIGDCFEKVLALFPQEKDWHESENGEFYGESSESDEPFLGALGKASTFDSDGINYKDMTLVTETQLPFFQLNFLNDILTEYRIYINIRID